MTERHCEISLDGCTGRLVLDGQELTNAVQSFTLRGGNNELPELEIDAAVLTGHVYGGPVEVLLHLPDETRQLLIREGWTPPPEP